jgi:hypothetical protein
MIDYDKYNTDLKIEALQKNLLRADTQAYVETKFKTASMKWLRELVYAYLNVFDNTQLYRLVLERLMIRLDDAHVSPSRVTGELPDPMTVLSKTIGDFWMFGMNINDIQAKNLYKQVFPNGDVIWGLYANDVRHHNAVTVILVNQIFDSIDGFREFAYQLWKNDQEWDDENHLWLKFIESYRLGVREWLTPFLRRNALEDREGMPILHGMYLQDLIKLEADELQ